MYMYFCRVTLAFIQKSHDDNVFSALELTQPMLLLYRFGYLYEEFRSYEQSLITQFALLVGDSSPDYSNNKLMCLYVIGL